MPTDELVEDTSAPKQGAGIRGLLLRLHFYAGVLVGPFVLIAALTGLLYVFTPQLEQALYPRELHVPATAGEQPLAAQVDAARAVHPQGTLSAVRPGPTPTDTTQVIFKSPGLPDSYFHTVFVNPHDGEIRGSLTTYGSGQALPFRTWMDQLHRNLHLGEAGRVYSELAASWLWVVVAGGLALWWWRRRRPDRAATGRNRTMRRHGLLGAWIAVPLLFLSATGLSWSLFAGENISTMRSAFNWETPSVTGTVSHHEGHASHDNTTTTGVGPDEVLAAARTAGLDNPVEIKFPSDGVYVVQQIGREWPSKQDSAAIDAGTGAVLDVLRFEDHPLMAKLTRWGIDAHMGLLFGLANQIVLTIVASGLIVLIVLGYRMWWQRRPTRGFGRPIPRGAWRRVPPKVLAPLAVAAVLVGLFLPVFGASLLGFLVIDALLARRTAKSV